MLSVNQIQNKSILNLLLKFKSWVILFVQVLFSTYTKDKQLQNQLKREKII
jgi:hypothetical protein